jgi:cobalt/nickel transport system permease protein
LIAETFSEGNSPLHRIDPRVKLCLALVYVFFVALSENMLVSCAALALGTMLVVMAGLKTGLVLKRLRLLFLFILLLWITLPLSVPGTVAYTLGRLSVTFEGLRQALSISLKATAIVLLVMALLGTSTVFSLVHALSHFRLPKKLLYLFFLSYRYVYVIGVEYYRLRDAMRIRGFRAGMNMHTYRSYGYLIGMLLIRSFERSERIYHAMLCRGFRGRFYLLHHFHLHRWDIVFLLVMSLILMGMGLTEWLLTIA